jgi:hypothetical protein
VSHDGDQTQKVSLFEYISERYEKAAHKKNLEFVPIETGTLSNIILQDWHLLFH